LRAAPRAIQYDARAGPGRGGGQRGGRARPSRTQAIGVFYMKGPDEQANELWTKTVHETVMLYIKGPDEQAMNCGRKL
jgi:hypothetical protein